ncbi:uridine cytidine kinase 2 [Echinococcus multilocularis]|uniref:uridine/cytidine kinase n=1 Tax=Echinococcus multilocularis TaxID=6211 RepID=A0A068YCE5_ECHMU|nr:uridine cytidine kinase 2 [Echinococcus multilocularis]
MGLSSSPKPLLIGVSGGAASGKNETCAKIIQELNKKAKGKRSIVLSLYSFYHDLSEEDIKLAECGKLDLDHPNAFDFDALADVLRKIVRGESVVLNSYDPEAFSNSPQKIEIPADIDVVIVEGILTFYQKEIRDMFHLKIFVQADADTRLSRKVIRDVVQRKRNLDAVLDNYFKFVKPAFEQFCLPTKKYADVILPRAPENQIAADLIIEHLLQLISSSPNSCLSSPPGNFPILRLRNQSEPGVAATSIRPH